VKADLLYEHRVLDVAEQREHRLDAVLDGDDDVDDQRLDRRFRSGRR